MKIAYNRFIEMSCFTIREKIGAPELKMLELGLEPIFKELEVMMVVNLVHAKIDPAFLPTVIAFKKKINSLTKQKVFWIAKYKGLGDFPKIDLMLSRFQGSKMRQIGDRINLEDQIYELEAEIATIEAQILKLDFNEAQTKKANQKNELIKMQKDALDACLKFQMKRKTKYKAVPCTIEEYELRVQATIADLQKLTGKTLDL